MRTLIQDCRFGFRMLTKRPGFLVVATLTVGLGIGANTALFSAVHAILLNPLALPQPDRLVAVQTEYRNSRLNTGRLSLLEIEDLRARRDLFAGVAFWREQGYNLGGASNPVRVKGLRVSGEFFSVLGVKPAMGRMLSAEDATPGHARVAVLSYGLWQEAFGGKADALGRMLVLNGERYEVAGVMPEEFRFPVAVSVWTPFVASRQLLTPQLRGAQMLSAMARLNPGIPVEQARQQLGAEALKWRQRFPQIYNPQKGHTLRTVPLQDQLVQDLRPALWVLMAAVGLVLLMASANVANLLLVRNSSRSREIAIRSSIGASRWQIIRQLIVEGLCLSAAGGVLGLLLAVWGVDLLSVALSAQLPHVGAIVIDGQVLLFSACMTLLSGLLFSVAPAWQLSRVDLQEALRQGGVTAGSESRPGRRRLRATLVAAQTALALILLTGAGLLLRSLEMLLHLDLGFRPDRVLTLRIPLDGAQYAETAKSVAFYQSLLARLPSLGGIEAAGLITALPFSGEESWSDFGIVGHDTPVGQPWPQADIRFVGGDYFQAMGIPLRRGRLMTASDGVNAPPIALIDETLAKQYWPGEDPIGRQICCFGEKASTIVGVVGQVRHSHFETAVKGVLYLPYTNSQIGGMTLVVRSSGRPAATVAMVRGAIAETDRQLPVYDVKTMEQRLGDSVARRRFAAMALLAFAAMALLLATLGIYGVTAAAVAQRTREIGIRVALGAERSSVLALILSEGMRVSGLGLAVGLAASLALTRFLNALLYGVGAHDPATFAASIIGLAAVALLACYFPARRALKVDPMTALRYE